MTPMETYSAVLLDEDGYPPCCPQLGTEAVGHGPLSSSFTICLRCAAVKAGGRPGENEPSKLLPHALQGIAPTHHRTRCAADHAADLLRNSPHRANARPDGGVLRSAQQNPSVAAPVVLPLGDYGHIALLRTINNVRRTPVACGDGTEEYSFGQWKRGSVRQAFCEERHVFFCCRESV